MRKRYILQFRGGILSKLFMALVVTIAMLSVIFLPVGVMILIENIEVIES